MYRGTALFISDTNSNLVTEYIQLAMDDEGELGSEMVRAPRLQSEGAERAEILGRIRTRRTRPTLGFPGTH